MATGISPPAAVPRDSGHASDSLAPLVPVVPELRARVRRRRVASNPPSRAPASLPGPQGPTDFGRLAGTAPHPSRHFQLKPRSANRRKNRRPRTPLPQALRTHTTLPSTHWHTTSPPPSTSEWNVIILVNVDSFPRQRGRNPARHDSPRYRFNGSRPLVSIVVARRALAKTISPSRKLPLPTPLHAVSRDNCDNCGATGCERSRCPARGRTCYGCGRRGHFQSVCRSSRRGQPRRPAPVRELLCDDDAESGHSILTICTNKRRGLYVDVDVSVINPKPLTRKVSFLIDTGSAVSIIGEGHFQNLFQDKVQLRTPSITLFDFSRQKIPVLGLFKATLSYKSRTAVVPLYVTCSGTSLLGLDAVQALNFQISGKELRCLHTVVQQTSASATSTLPATSSDAQGRIPPQGAIVEQPQSVPKFGMPALLWARFSHLYTPGLGLVRGFQHKLPTCAELPKRIDELKSRLLSESDRMTDHIVDKITEKMKSSGVDVLDLKKHVDSLESGLKFLNDLVDTGQ
ncbi:hypothetical protein MRX96_000945 [Rhipicephalus microplus]